MDPTSLSAINRQPPALPSLNTIEVIEAINKIYQVLEQWQGAEWDNTNAAKCDVKSFTAIVEDIQLHGRKFSSAIDLSVKTSKDGIALAKDSLMFLEAIEEEYDEDTLGEFFDGLLQIAKAGVERAERCEQYLQEIRTGIVEISNCVPKATKDVSKRRRCTETNALRCESAAELWQIGADALGDVRRNEVFLSAASPASLIFPTALPFLQTIAYGMGRMYEKSLEERKRESVTLDDAFEKLLSLEADLEGVHSRLGQLVKWWSDIEHRLYETKRILDSQGVSLYHDISVQGSLRNAWTDIEEQYSGYHSKVTKFRDYYRIKPLEELDVGFKGRLLTLQKDVKAFYDGLIKLKDVSEIIRGGYHEPLRRSLNSTQAEFVSRLAAIIGCLEQLGRIDRGPSPALGRMGCGHAMHKPLHGLLTQDNIHTRICAVELSKIRRLVDKECSRTKSVFGNLKMRGTDSEMTPASALRLLDGMEETTQKISGFCIDLAMSGPWHVDGFVADRNLGNSVSETQQRLTWFKEKLERGPMK